MRLLREECLFTAEQLRRVLVTCPAALLDEPRRLHHHFQVRRRRPCGAGACPGAGAVRDSLCPARSTRTSGWGSSKGRW